MIFRKDDFMDILDMLKGLDSDALEKGIAQAKKFLSTPEGQSMAKSLSEGKMPDGAPLDENLKNIAEKIKTDENARQMLGELIRAKR